MSTSNLLKLSLALILLGGAAFGFHRFLNRKAGATEQCFYYDLSENKLFAGPLDALPPIRGLHGTEEDGVRAIVICTSGNPDNPADRSIAYLEKYAPELKENMNQVRAGKAEPLSSKVRNAYTFVKRVQDEEWQAVGSPGGQAIINAWSIPGPDGKPPVVCVP